MAEAKTPTQNPHTKRAETSVLGCVMVGGRVLFEQLKIRLCEADFYTEFHQRVWRAFEQIFEQGREIDPVAVIQHLRYGSGLTSEQTLAISEFADTVHSLAAAQSYAWVVRRDADTRRTLEVLRAKQNLLVDKYVESDDLQDAIDELQKIQSGLESGTDQKTNVQDLCLELFRKLEKNETFVPGFQTGIGSVDREFLGFRPQELYIIAARPSMGKTSLALQFARRIDRQTDLPVAVFSLETSKEVCLMRLISNLGGAPIGNLIRGDVLDFAQPIIKATTKLKGSKIEIFDSFDLSPSRLREHLWALSRKHGGIGAVVIDYLQLMQSDKNYDSQNNAISEITRSIKKMSKEFNTPIILLSQLSRANEKRSKDETRPKLSDLRGSGAIEQDCDVVFFLHADDHSQPFRELIVAKQKNGPCFEAQLRFNGAYLHFD